jgi:hypothetical protein
MKSRAIHMPAVLTLIKAIDSAFVAAMFLIEMHWFVFSMVNERV